MAHSADLKVYALFKMHQLSDLHINACFFYVEQIIFKSKTLYMQKYYAVYKNYKI